MICQVTVEVSTHEEEDASLLAQQLDGWMALVDSLRTDAQVRLACIPSTDEALHDLITFAFVALHLFSAAGRHLSAVSDIIRLIKRLEEIHTKVQRVTTSLNLATKLVYNVSPRWLLYLNRCVTALSSEDIGAAGATVPFSLEPILLELEVGCYV